MEVSINNKIQEIQDNSKLSQLLLKLNLIEQKGIAIAINNRVITRSAWNATTLNQNDKITIIKATQGG